jgi:uncharacterized protein
MDKNHRCCLSCRKVGPKEAFWRIVRCHGDRTIQLDTGMGRSAYLCPTADCLKQAQKKKRIGRSLRTAVPDTIYQALEQRLTASS